MTEVAVALGHCDAAVPQNLLHFIETAARVDQKAGKAVAQVVHPNFRQSRCCAGSVPTGEDADVGLQGLGVGEYRFPFLQLIACC